MQICQNRSKSNPLPCTELSNKEAIEQGNRCVDETPTISSFKQLQSFSQLPRGITQSDAASHRVGQGSMGAPRSTPVWHGRSTLIWCLARRSTLAMQSRHKLPCNFPLSCFLCRRNLWKLQKALGSRNFPSVETHLHHLEVYHKTRQHRRDRTRAFFSPSSHYDTSSLRFSLVSST